MVGLNSLASRITSWLDRQPATGQANPVGTASDGDHWMLCTIAMSDAGDVDFWIEDSPDNSVWTEVPGSRVSVNALADTEHHCHTIVVDRFKRERYVRPNWAITSGGPAVSLTSILIQDNTHVNAPVQADITTAGHPGGVSEI